MSPSLDSCLLCGGALTLVLDGLRDNQGAAAGVFAIHCCHVCGAEQTLPRLTAEAQRALDKRRHDLAAGEGDAPGAARRAGFRDWLVRTRLDRLWARIDGDVSFHRARGRGRLLETGCGAGLELESYRANGFDAEGWEAERAFAAPARARGFTVHGTPLGEFQPPAPYDVIVLSGLLGQSRDPRATLREARRLLAPGGELWIALPNAASLFREIFGRDWINWQAPYRAVHFSPRLLRRLLAEEGFEVRAFDCVTPTLWLTRSCLVTLYGRPGAPTERLNKPLLLAGWMLTLRLFFFPTLFFLNRAMRGDWLILRAGKSAD